MSLFLISKTSFRFSSKSSVFLLWAVRLLICSGVWAADCCHYRSNYKAEAAWGLKLMCQYGIWLFHQFWYRAKIQTNHPKDPCGVYEGKLKKYLCQYLDLEQMFERIIDVVIRKIIIALDKRGNQHSCEIERLSFDNIQLQHDIVYEFPRQIPSIA